MKLSFVIPAHNEERLLGECLRSVIAQTTPYPDIEIIVVNNASTDKTEAIARAFKEVRVVNEPDKGLVKARKAGFLASTGELVANIDADTILTPKWVEKALLAFDKSPKLVALSGPYIYYDLSLITNFFVFTFYGAGYLIYLLGRLILRFGSMLQGGNFVVRRSAIEKIGFDTKNFDFYGEDTDLARRLSALGPTRFTFHFPMYTSARRLKKEGVLTMGVRYAINHIWTSLFGRPFTKKSTDVRTK